MPETDLDQALRDRLIAAGVAPTFAGFLARLEPAEHANAERLAAARQAIAAKGFGAGAPPWADLTEDERAGMTVTALHWLRAARSIGLAR